MAAQAEEITIPAWVPEIIKNTVFQIIKPTDEKEWATLKRLLTDKRMKGVWNEITKHRRDLSTYQTTEERFHKPSDVTIGMQVIEDQLHPVKADFNTALQNFFYVAYDLAANPVDLLTRDEVMEIYGEFADVSLRSVQLAALLRKLFSRHPGLIPTINIWRSRNPDLKHFGLSRDLVSKPPLGVDDFIEQLEECGRFFQSRHLMSTFEPVPPFNHVVRFKPEGKRPVVTRRTTHDKTRAYVLALAKTCKTTFGTYLYRVVATVASVALRERTTGEYVRKAVKGREL
jgi:hypothetical protein